MASAISDSSTGGPLLPAPAPAPLEDDQLDDFIQAFVVGLTGMPGTLVFPRWQEEPPNIPQDGVDWAAVGVMQRTGDTYAAEEHQSDGVTVVTRHETLDVHCTFYGPHCQKNGAEFRDNLGLGQNHEVLFNNGMGLVGVGQLEKNADLVKMRWLSTADVPFQIRRIIVRQYPIRDIASLDLTLQTEAVSVIYDNKLAAQPKEAVP